MLEILEPRRRYTFEGRSKGNIILLGVVVEHRQHNAEVVGHYVIVIEECIIIPFERNQILLKCEAFLSFASNMRRAWVP